MNRQKKTTISDKKRLDLLQYIGANIEFDYENNHYANGLFTWQVKIGRTQIIGRGRSLRDAIDCVFEQVELLKGDK